MKFLCSLILAAALVPVSALGEGRAMPTKFLHPLFSNHAVLQRDVAVPVWGHGPAGGMLVVSFGDQIKQVKVGEDGKWMCTLDPMPASFDGRVLQVSNPLQNEADMATDVLVGDVWLCSGQSNMEMGLVRANEQEEIQKANHPNLRLLTIPHEVTYKPKDSFTAKWRRCSPEAILEDDWGGFSAVAYFFGKKLHEELKVPIGLIHSSWGGTMIEAWTSNTALNQFPQLQGQLKQVNELASSDDPKALDKMMDEWFQKHDPGTQQEWHKGKADTSKWRDVKFPGTWADCGIKGHEGVTWIQRKFTVPDDWANQSLRLTLGTVSDTDTTWINGKEVGRTNSFEVPSVYRIDVGIVRPGENVITVRITNAGGGGIHESHQPMELQPEFTVDFSKAYTLRLSGEWKLKETSKKNKTGRPIVGNPRVATVLYNSMIAPLTPAALTGVIWYQGEANADQGKLYGELLPAMMEDWRKHFKKDDLAFHIVSLASYMPRHDQPRNHGWAELREAQAMSAKNDPHSGLAVTIDIGDAADIHPKNKRDVGLRLALSALDITYGQDAVGSGPWFKKAEMVGGKIKLHFDHTDGGLKFKGAADKAFAIAGKDGKFVWAEAKIEGDTVVVSSPKVASPMAVRYAWDANPQAPLYNGAGLPAVPFRSDTK